MSNRAKGAMAILLRLRLCRQHRRAKPAEESNGFVATCDGAPVLCGSKVSSVAFAHPDIGESHADVSSGANEIHAAGNATHESLHLSCIADEMGIDFPKPIPLQMDNTAAESFAKNNAKKTKLKHIDARQEWVKVLRDKSMLAPAHACANETKSGRCVHQDPHCSRVHPSPECDCGATTLVMRAASEGAILEMTPTALSSPALSRRPPSPCSGQASLGGKGPHGPWPLGQNSMNGQWGPEI